MTRVLACGGRTFRDARVVRRTLDKIHAGTPITCLIDGGANGADTLAFVWAGDHQIERLTFEADWDRYGKAAGPIRNQRMLREGAPDLVVAFPGGVGTAHMVSIAREAGVRVIEVDSEGNSHDRSETRDENRDFGF